MRILYKTEVKILRIIDFQKSVVSMTEFWYN